MASQLATGEVEDDKSHAQKLVPWLSWDEWELVRESLFSDSPESITFALDRVAAWRSRGCLPVTVEVTSSIIKIQQKDPMFRVELSSDVSEDEEMLAMLYSMAVMRLVNGLIEKTRQRTSVSIAQAAAKINMPRMLIDIRHETSHRELPSLLLLRQASSVALNWLKSYYWDPQKKAIPFRGGESSSVREEIMSKLHQLARWLKKKQGSSDIKEKRVTKQIAKTLKSLLNLYAFFSSEVITIFLEFLLEVPSPLNMAECPDKFQDSLSLGVARTAFDKWKPVMSKFSKKEPELLISLLNAVVDMIEARQTMRDDIGQKHYSVSAYEAETCRIEVLSSLFSWLVEILIVLKSLYCDNIESVNTKKASLLPKSILLDLFRRCLLIAEPGNDSFFASALLLAEVFGNGHLNRRLKKLSLVLSPCLDLTEENDISSTVDSGYLARQEKDIQQASKKVELLKRRKLNSSSTQATPSTIGTTSKWAVVESWKPCPIGMLPRTLGSSGYLPVLDCNSQRKETLLLKPRMEEKVSWNSIDNSELVDAAKESGENLREDLNLGNEENKDAGTVGVKRGSSSSLDESSNPPPKRVCSGTPSQGNNPSDIADKDALADWSIGRLFVNGVFKRVEEDEVKRIQSCIRILVLQNEISSTPVNVQCEVSNQQI